MKVLLVSEHQLLQNLLHIALERKTGIRIVGEFLEGKTAVRWLADPEKAEAPDLIIQGLVLPDMDGIALTEQLRQLQPGSRILAVTGQQESSLLIPFLLAGGHGYLSQYPSDEEFYRAIEDVISGRIYLNSSGYQVLDATCHRLEELRGRVIRREVLEEETSPIIFCGRQLSEREKQVLHLYVNGYSSSEIGSILYMSVNTVETHKKRIKVKLNLSRKADLTVYAKQNGLFEDWD